MQRTRAIPQVLLSLMLLAIVAGCSGVDDVRNRLSNDVGDSVSGRLAERSSDALARLDGVSSSDIDVLRSETVTLQQLQDAGIPVGSHQIDCDQPLHIVVMEGVFDRDSLFETGATMAGGHAEGMAMRLVGQIYDPETEMPLGMIGDSTGGRLNNLSESGSMPSGSGSAELTFAGDTSQDAGTLVPEAVCQ